MNEETKLGFVTLPALYVFERAITVLCEVTEKREAKRKAFVQEIIDKSAKPRWFRKARPPMTEDEAIAAIQANDDLYWYYWSLEADNLTPKQKKLQTLVDVSCRMIQRQSEQENTDMMLTIEAADMIN